MSKPQDRQKATPCYDRQSANVTCTPRQRRLGRAHHRQFRIYLKFLAFYLSCGLPDRHAEVIAVPRDVAPAAATRCNTTEKRGFLWLFRKFCSWMGMTSSA